MRKKNKQIKSKYNGKKINSYVTLFSVTRVSVQRQNGQPTTPVITWRQNGQPHHAKPTHNGTDDIQWGDAREVGEGVATGDGRHTNTSLLFLTQLLSQNTPYDINSFFLCMNTVDLKLWNTAFPPIMHELSKQIKCFFGFIQLGE